METIREYSWLIVLAISSLALLVLVLRMWLRKKRRENIERDASGLWRYHRETQIRYRSAYGETLLEEQQAKEKKDKGKKDKAKKDKKKSDQESATAKVEKDKKEEKKAVAVINFLGDLRAKQHTTLARLVDELEINKDRFCEVVVSITSPGGGVPQYGHAYSQMVRIKELGLNLTVCIDVVAASGGYLMSLPANKIIAAPFAVVGSIGVMAFIPNIRQLLLDWRIKPRTFTAGGLKRTVTLTDEATPEETAHFQQQLDNIHRLFKEAVAKYRPQIDLAQIATGDHWSAVESIESNLGLVDQLGTTQGYLLTLNRDFDLAHLTQKRNVWEDGVGRFFGEALDRIEDRVFSWSSARR